MTRPAHRRVSRLILVDEDDRFLLLLTASPRLATPMIKWITPGGGVDEGESHAEGAIRELFEETGLLVENVGEPVHSISGETVFHDGHVQTTYAEFFLVRTQSFEVSKDNWLDYEHDDIRGIRWWSLDELRETSEEVGPVNLADIISHVLSA